jgi:hypothetical protein
MQVQIESSGIVLSRAETQVLVKRFHRAFQRFADRIDGLHVNLREADSPLGRPQTLCLVRIQLARHGQLVVRERNPRIRRAVRKTISRGRALVAYKLHLADELHELQRVSGASGSPSRLEPVGAKP